MLPHDRRVMGTALPHLHQQDQRCCVSQRRYRELSPESPSQWGAGPVLPSVAVAVSTGWGQLRTAPSSLPLVVSEAKDINRDHGYISAVNPAAAQTQTSPWPWVEIKSPTSACSSPISPFQISLRSQDRSHAVSLSLLYNTIHLLTIVVPVFLTLQGAGGSGFSPRSPGQSTLGLHVCLLAPFSLSSWQKYLNSAQPPSAPGSWLV